MARKAKDPVIVNEAPVSHEAIATAHAAMNELAVMNMELADNVKALAELLGYSGSLDADVLESGIQSNNERMQMEILEAGKRLLLLREQCQNGDFFARLERLDITPRAAQKFMQATLRFSDAPTSARLERFGKSKILELLVLDDEEIKALTDGGSARGITLDDADCMSISELRNAFREFKANETATDRVIEGMQKANTKLQKQLAGKQIDPQAEWSEAMRSLNAHVAAHRNTFVESITALDVIREKVMEQVAEPGAEAALEAARAQIGRELAEAMQRAEEIVAALRHKFEITLGALIGD